MPSYHDEDTLRELYWEEGMTLEEIGEKFDTGSTTINRWMKKNGIDRRTAAQNRPVHYRTDDSGYECWRHDTNGTQHKVLVHRLQKVAEEGIEAVKGMEVHHKNRIKWDNRPSNLELVTPQEHREITGEQIRVDAADISDQRLRKYIYGESMSINDIAEEEGCKKLAAERCLEQSPVWRRFLPGRDNQIVVYVVENNSIEFAADYFGYVESTIEQRLRAAGRHDLTPNRMVTVEDKYDKEELQRLYQDEGYQLNEISDEIGVSRGRVSQIFDIFNIETGATSRTPSENPWSDKEKMRTLVEEENMTRTEIASHFDCSLSVVSDWISKHDLEVNQTDRDIPSYGDNPWRDQEVLYTEYVENGNGYKALSNAWGCSESTIKRWVEKFDFEKHDSATADSSSNPWQDEDILYREYVEKGKGRCKLALQWGCAECTILRWVEKFDFEKHSPTEHDEFPWQDEDRLREMYHDQQMTQQEIADELGCSSPTVAKWLDRHGIETRTTGETLKMK